jgi:hypothetical protein
MARRARGVTAVVVTALATAWAPAARAELREVAERVAQAWREGGAYVVVDRTRFLNDDESAPVILPPLPASPAECTTVVLLGARGLGFHANLSRGGPDEGVERIPSEAGALSFERCGDAMPRRIAVTADSGRGAVELVVARSPRGVKPLREVLPERASGAAAPASEPGSLPVLSTPAHRADLAEARARRDGATVATRATWGARASGGGSGADMLAPGCHVIELLAPDPRATAPDGRGKLDLDAEMRDASGDRVLARDRSDAPDARLSVCVGEDTAIQVAFVGAPSRAPVLEAHWSWPLPAHLPSAWGAEAVARMAHVLLTRRADQLPREPAVLLQGGPGLTPLAIRVQPGACYVALLAVTQGSARTITLRARVGTRESLDDRGPDENGGLVAFCAEASHAAVIDVEAHGTPLLGWGFALYRVVDAVWEAPR